jgi:predicted RNase H-like HicB family nuclease
MAAKKQLAIRLNIHLPAVIKKKDKWFTASCPSLDVISQGETAEKAKENLAEALSLFLISCYERGTLTTVLKDCGFKPSPVTSPDSSVPEPDYVDVPLPFMIDDMAKHHQCHA